MGFYIETASSFHKAQTLVTSYKGVIVSKPSAFEDIPADKALVCVVDNSAFEAAALVYSANELRRFSLAIDKRPKSWVLLDKVLAHELACYSEGK